jgi:hypothetical protein
MDDERKGGKEGERLSGEEGGREEGRVEDVEEVVCAIPKRG